MKKIKLVLSGSGMLYPLHVGGILRLAEAGYEIVEVCGTSGGALVAAALGTGYKPNSELVKLAKETLPHKNNSMKFSLWSLYKNWGLVNTSNMKKQMGKYLSLKLGETKIPINIIVTDLEHRRFKILNTKTNPDQSLSEAVIASMTIPGIFEKIKIDNSTCVDGGFSANFPLDIFGTEEGVIGFKVRSKGSEKPKKIKTIKQYISATTSTLLEATTNHYIASSIYAKTIFLDSVHSATNYNMTDSDIDEMVNEGYSSVNSWLKENPLYGLRKNK